MAVAAIAFPPKQRFPVGGISGDHGRDPRQRADKGDQPPDLIRPDRSEGGHLGSLHALGDDAKQILILSSGFELSSREVRRPDSLSLRLGAFAILPMASGARDGKHFPAILDSLRI